MQLARDWPDIKSQIGPLITPPAGFKLILFSI
jgi:hypothetical protein